MSLLCVTKHLHLQIATKYDMPELSMHLKLPTTKNAYISGGSSIKRKIAGGYFNWETIFL